MNYLDMTNKILYSGYLEIDDIRYFRNLGLKVKFDYDLSLYNIIS